jgi:hypothetical protein
MENSVTSIIDNLSR